MLLADEPGCFQTVQHWHLHVHQNQIESVAGLQLTERFLAVIGQFDRETALASHTVLNGKFVLRLAIGNMGTQWEDLQETWNLVRQAAKK
jgi:hypothetical protein